MQSTTKRLAKNTLYMYIRMAITMLISLYSSRVLLKILGVEDFGIFNLVGSIIATVGMFKLMFVSSTQRFLNVEMGRQNSERLNLIFNMSMLINIIIAVVFMIIAEIVGLWFFEYKVNIDPSRLTAAVCVFHLSVLSSAITIITSPFDAVIIANEKMNFYALVSILDSVLRLSIIFLIPLFNKDNLIVYGCLLLVVSLLIRFINSQYCSKNFSECKYRKCWDKDIFKQMFSFAGWQMLGTSAYTLTQNGINLVFNVFGGAIVNAARGISSQVNSAVFQFLHSVSVTITPYSMKAFGEGNNQKVFNMLLFSSKVLLLINACLSLPIIFLAPEILKVWLGEVPPYTLGFVRIVLCRGIIRSVHQPMDTMYKSFGKIKEYQIVEGIMLFAPLVVAYILLRMGFSFYIALSSLAVFEFINLVAIVVLAKKIVSLNILDYLKGVLSHIVVIGLAGFLVYYTSCVLFNNLILRIIASITIDLILVGYLFTVMLSKEEKKSITSLLSRRTK